MLDNDRSLSWITTGRYLDYDLQVCVIMTSGLPHIHRIASHATDYINQRCRFARIMLSDDMLLICYLDGDLIQDK